MDTNSVFFLWAVLAQWLDVGRWLELWQAFYFVLIISLFSKLEYIEPIAHVVSINYPRL